MDAVLQALPDESFKKIATWYSTEGHDGRYRNVT
jgi:hypothetical protein